MWMFVLPFPLICLMIVRSNYADDFLTGIPHWIILTESRHVALGHQVHWASCSSMLCNDLIHLILQANADQIFLRPRFYQSWYRLLELYPRKHVPGRCSCSGIDEKWRIRLLAALPSNVHVNLGNLPYPYLVSRLRQWTD